MHTLNVSWCVYVCTEDTVPALEIKWLMAQRDLFTQTTHLSESIFLCIFYFLFILYLFVFTFARGIATKWIMQKTGASQLKGQSRSGRISKSQ